MKPCCNCGAAVDNKAVVCPLCNAKQKEVRIKPFDPHFVLPRDRLEEDDPSTPFFLRLYEIAIWGLLVILATIGYLLFGTKGIVVAVVVWLFFRVLF